MTTDGPNDLVGPERVSGEPVEVIGESVRMVGDPLIYIDGIRVNEMPDLDPDAIERIEVLKGAAAAALYGEEASNGVVQIFLKADAASNPGG